MGNYLCNFPIIVSVVSVVATLGIGLATLIVPSLRDLRRDGADLRGRMARLEGLFERVYPPGDRRPGSDAMTSK